jgi:phage-related minor tail protein
LAEQLDSTLSARLRQIISRGSLTESELREAIASADGWARALRAQIRASERRLRRLTADPTSGVAEAADELRRLEALKPQLEETEALAAELETTARGLRTAWLLGQTEAAKPS